MQSIINTLINNFVVAALVPSLVFCSSLMLMFRPRISPVAIDNIVSIYKETGLFVLFAAFVLSLFIFYLRDLLFRLYRGGFFPRGFQKAEQRRATRYRRQINALKRRITSLESSSPGTAAKLKNRQYSLISSYRLQFPSRTNIAPTRFGNILAAAEDCMARRYKLDAVVLWPRLLNLAPALHIQKMEETINQLSLLINSSFLSFVFSMIMGIAALLSWLSSRAIPREFSLALIIALAAFYVFYKASLPLAEKYATMYCGTFDLFRFEIFKQMRLKCPENSITEKQDWQKISEWLNVGTDLAPLYFEYDHSDNSLKVELK